MAWRKTACITWSINLEVSSLCIATKELRLPSPVRGVQLLKRQKTQPQSFLLAAPSAQRMMRYGRTKVHFQHIELKTNNAMLSLLFLVFFSIISFQSRKPFLIQRRGAEFALTTIARHFGADLTKSLPYLWENTVGPLTSVATENQCIGMLIMLIRF